MRWVQRCSEVGVTRTGWGIDTRLTRRSAQEKSFFFFPGAQLARRPAASVTGGQPCPTLSSDERVPEPLEACASYLPRRHCPPRRWECPRWPTERGSEKSNPPDGTAEGLAGPHTRALLLNVLPAPQWPPGGAHPAAAHTPCSSNLALIKVGLPGSECSYLWATSFSACFPCPCYLPGSPP